MSVMQAIEEYKIVILGLMEYCLEGIKKLPGLCQEAYILISHAFCKEIDKAEAALHV